MKYHAIIPAAGKSSRFKKDKLNIKLNNELLIKHTVYNFQVDKDCEKIILVVASNKFDYYKNLFRLSNKLVVVLGGSSRGESVKKGLQYCLKSKYVLIHDGARPYVTDTLINNVKENLIDNQIVIPVIDEVDSIIDVSGNEIQYVNRNNFKRIQTPQGFETNTLVRVYEENVDVDKFNDEASMILSTIKNVKYTLIQGEYKNIKITTEQDVSEIEYDS